MYVVVYVVVYHASVTPVADAVAEVVGARQRRAERRTVLQRVVNADAVRGAGLAPARVVDGACAVVVERRAIRGLHTAPPSAGAARAPCDGAGAGAGGGVSWAGGHAAAAQAVAPRRALLTQTSESCRVVPRHAVAVLLRGLPCPAGGMKPACVHGTPPGAERAGAAHGTRPAVRPVEAGEAPTVRGGRGAIVCSRGVRWAGLAGGAGRVGAEGVVWAELAGEIDAQVRLERASRARLAEIVVRALVSRLAGTPFARRDVSAHCLAVVSTGHALGRPVVREVIQRAALLGAVSRAVISGLAHFAPVQACVFSHGSVPRSTAAGALVCLGGEVVGGVIRAGLAL